MSDKARAELAPTGVLRAGINLSNFLLVTGRSEKSEPVGVAPDMAKEIAASLGVPVTYVPFKSPGELADQAGKNVWDIGLIGAEPQRAAVMTFTRGLCRDRGDLHGAAGLAAHQSIADVDKKGVRIAVSARSAYGLWLENNIKNATLMPISGPRRRLQQVHGRQARRAGGAAARPAEGSREASRSSKSSTASSPPFSRRSAATSPPPRVRAISRSSSRRPRNRAWWRA